MTPVALGHYDAALFLEAVATANDFAVDQSKSILDDTHGAVVVGRIGGDWLEVRTGTHASADEAAAVILETIAPRLDDQCSVCLGALRVPGERHGHLDPCACQSDGSDV